MTGRSAVNQEGCCILGGAIVIAAFAVPVAAWHWNWPRELMLPVTLVMMIVGVALYYRGYRFPKHTAS
jgi:hypothetical protein